MTSILRFVILSETKDLIFRTNQNRCFATLNMTAVRHYISNAVGVCLLSGRRRNVVVLRPQHPVYCFQNHRFEYFGVTPHVGMHLVGAPLAGHAAALVGECRMVVEPVYPLARGIFAQHRIQVGYRLRRSHLPAPAELRSGRYGTEYNPYPMRLGEFAHRRDVAQNILVRYGTVVLCDVVRASHDDYRPWTEVEYVAAEAHEHLRRRLTADTASDEIVAREKERVELRPVVGNRIAHEYRVGTSAAAFQVGVRPLVATEFSPVLRLLRRGLSRCAGDAREEQKRYGNDSFHGRSTCGCPCRIAESRWRQPYRRAICRGEPYDRYRSRG